MVVSWQAPGLDRYSHDWLMRIRGPVPVSGEIAIIAIDDASIAKLGRFPWACPLIARAVDAIAAGQPRAVALDILFTDPTNAPDDQALADAMRRAQNVVLSPNWWTAASTARRLNGSRRCLCWRHLRQQRDTSMSGRSPMVPRARC